jgi:insulysin
LLDLLARILYTELNETAHLASEASLNLSVSNEEYGLDLAVDGYSQKLGLLLAVALEECLALGDAKKWSERMQDKGFLARLAAQREEQLREYRNSDIKPEDHAAELRLLLLCPHRHSTAEYCSALEAVDTEALTAFGQTLLPQLRAELLVTGNASEGDAEIIAQGLPRQMYSTSADGAARHPDLDVVVVPSGPPTVWIADSPDAGNPNTAVEFYWQLGGVQDVRLCAIAHLIQTVMAVPLFDTLRTKHQLCYIVNCAIRNTHGVLGFSIMLQSSNCKPAPICNHIELFLVEFRKAIVDMPADIFEQHVVSLAAQKLEAPDTQNEVHARAWVELQRQRYQFDRAFVEVGALKTVERSDVLQLLDDAVLLGAKDRRMIIVAALGGRVGTSCVEVREALIKRYGHIRGVISQAEFHAGTTFYEK